jgi:hypothetical protein
MIVELGIRRPAMPAEPQEAHPNFSDDIAQGQAVRTQWKRYERTPRGTFNIAAQVGSRKRIERRRKIAA